LSRNLTWVTVKPTLVSFRLWPSCASDGATMADRSRPELTLLSTPIGARWRMDICRELQSQAILDEQVARLRKDL
jgi:hypothetical protein